jgi:GT2 family glycosyltransferase
MIVVNRDGVTHLRALLGGLTESTDYPELELILVDNGSGDGSVEYVRSANAPFPIKVVANPRNESFSEACNQGAAMARGGLLLFLNNDIEPFEPGWLSELVACLWKQKAAAVASTLVCRDDEHARDFSHGYGVQHRGLIFVTEDGRAVPHLHGWEEDPLDDALGEDVECEAVAAACLLVSRSTFERVDGFTPGYFYGCEDVDFCLKLRAVGGRVVCSGRSVAVHHPASTRREVPFRQAHATKLANRRRLWKRWGAQLDDY